MKAVADELFHKVALSSTSSKDDYSNNVEGYVVDDLEYIEEVEEIRVDLCSNCLPMLQYDPTSFNAARTLQFVPVGKKRQSKTANHVSKEKRNPRTHNETHADNESKTSASLYCCEELK
eukprot:scaffold79989_cov55-Attheya_sp.AAC.1